MVAKPSIFYCRSAEKILAKTSLFQCRKDRFWVLAKPNPSPYCRENTSQRKFLPNAKKRFWVLDKPNLLTLSRKETIPKPSLFQRRRKILYLPKDASQTKPVNSNTAGNMLTNQEYCIPTPHEKSWPNQACFITARKMLANPSLSQHCRKGASRIKRVPTLEERC